MLSPSLTSRARLSGLSPTSPPHVVATTAARTGSASHGCCGYSRHSCCSCCSRHGSLLARAGPATCLPLAFAAAVPCSLLPRAAPTPRSPLACAAAVPCSLLAVESRGEEEEEEGAEEATEADGRGRSETEAGEGDGR